MSQLKWVWGQMKGFHTRYIFALVSTIILAVANLGNSIIIKSIMDMVFNPLSQGTVSQADVKIILWKLVAVLIIYTICRNIYLYFTVLTFEGISQKLIYKLRGDLYVKMQKQDMEFYSKNRTGDLMTRLTGDMDMIRHTVAWVLRMIIETVVMFVSTSILFFVVDYRMALCVLLVTPVIMIITGIFSKKVAPLYVGLRERLSQLNTAAQENISGNRVVKAFASEEYEISKFNQKNFEYKEANLKSSLLWWKFYPYLDILSQSLSVVVLLVGGIFLIMDEISIGEFTMLNGVCWMLSNPMRQLGMLLNDLQRFFASSSKIIELFYSRPSIKNPKNAFKKGEKIKGKVEFKDVSLTLNKTEVLKNINLTINPGETIAIMGSTGCGKTTLINLIPRFLDVNTGKLTVDDVEVKKWDLKSLRSAIGIANQDVFLFSDTVDGNIAYGNSSMSEENVAEYAKKAAVNFISDLSDGFDTIIGERGTGLSGGQKQRIALARALAVKPSILILDDTTSAVDMETERFIQKELDNLDYTCTKIIVAQRISTTKNADKIVIMDKGEIVQFGTHEELSKIDGYYHDVFVLQNSIDDGRNS
ncbi:MAG: ABC transporter ATP-binding protein [Oscillospiraceae bacterium]